jgi:hypothetical protein
MAETVMPDDPDARSNGDNPTRANGFVLTGELSRNWSTFWRCQSARGMSAPPAAGWSQLCRPELDILAAPVTGTDRSVIELHGIDVITVSTSRMTRGTLPHLGPRIEQSWPGNARLCRDATSPDGLPPPGRR